MEINALMPTLMTIEEASAEGGTADGGGGGGSPDSLCHFFLFTLRQELISFAAF